jgi:hypothetical protein
MEFAFSVFGGCMGYYSKSERFVGELERTIGTPKCFGTIEVDSFLLNMVYLERNDCKEL